MIAGVKNRDYSNSASIRTTVDDACQVLYITVSATLWYFNCNLIDNRQNIHGR